MFGLFGQSKRIKEAKEFTRFYFTSSSITLKRDPSDPDLIGDVAKNEPNTTPAGIAILAQVMYINNVVQDTTFCNAEIMDEIEDMHIPQIEVAIENSINNNYTNSYDRITAMQALEMLKINFKTQKNLRKS